MHGQKSRSLNIDFVYIQQESHVPLLFHLNCAEKINQKGALKVDHFQRIRVADAYQKFLRPICPCGLVTNCQRLHRG